VNTLPGRVYRSAFQLRDSDRSDSTTGHVRIFGKPMVAVEKLDGVLRKRTGGEFLSFEFWNCGIGEGENFFQSPMIRMFLAVRGQVTNLPIRN